MKSLTTPHYLIDESRLLKKFGKSSSMCASPGARSVLAPEMFLDLVRIRSRAGFLTEPRVVPRSEARLGREEFGKEVHAYSVGFSASDIESVKSLPNKGDLQFDISTHALPKRGSGLETGDCNPGIISYSHFDLPIRRGDIRGWRDRSP